MKIALSSQNQTAVTGHAGHCQRFWIYDVEGGSVQSKQLLELSKQQTFHETALDAPHALDTVQVLITGSMGTRLAQRLSDKGIEAVVTHETDPDSVVQAYLTGSLDIAAPGEHEHDHDHDHDCDHH